MGAVFLLQIEHWTCWLVAGCPFYFTEMKKAPVSLVVLLHFIKLARKEADRTVSGMRSKRGRTFQGCVHSCLWSFLTLCYLCIWFCCNGSTNRKTKRINHFVAVILIVVFVNEESTHSFLSVVFLHSKQHQKTTQQTRTRMTRI